MQLPDDDSNSFWYAVVDPRVKCRVKVPIGTECELTNAAVSQDDLRGEIGNITLYLKANDSDEVALVPFTLGHFESTLLDLRFVGGDILDFRIEGINVPVHICGYLNGGSSLILTNIDMSS